MAYAQEAYALAPREEDVDKIIKVPVLSAAL